MASAGGETGRRGGTAAFIGLDDHGPPKARQISQGVGNRRAVHSQRQGSLNFSAVLELRRTLIVFGAVPELTERLGKPLRKIIGRDSGST